jgi:cystathionine beta-lyase/cystathionine gamma-synthase
MQSSSVYSFETRAIHSGHSPDAETGAMLTPIVQSTTFAQSSIGEDCAHSYSRVSNPTVAALESAIASLDGRQHAVCFATGMSATTALFLSILSAGDEVICSDVIYGGTTRLLEDFLRPFGIIAHYVDTSLAVNVGAAINEKTKLVFIESPANPTLKLAAIAEIASLTKAAGIPLAVDNTFLTPLLQDCRKLGAEISLYSTTKYFDGHNATVGGAIALDDAVLAERLFLTRKTLGLNQKPFEAWLTLQGIQTLPLRLKRQSESALRLATWLEERTDVAFVSYPGLVSHPQHALAISQQESGGAIVAFELKGGFEFAKRFATALGLITLAENLGAAQSIITHPASMTHTNLSAIEKARLGITPGLVRLSVGLEGVEDLQRDLSQALSRANELVPLTKGERK